jgi:hypothetical protein
MTDNKLIPMDDLVQLVTEAGLRYQRGLLETSLSNLVVKDGDPFAELASAYELANSLGIPEETMDEVIANRYPSIEAQLHALEHHAAIATTHAVATTYQTELLRALRRALPASVFRATLDPQSRLLARPDLDVKWHRDYRVSLCLVSEREVTTPVARGWRNAFGLVGPRQRTEVAVQDTVLATVDVGNEYVGSRDSLVRPREQRHLYRADRLYIVVTISSGVFIKLCTDVLDSLRTRFEKHNGICGYEVVYDYVVE